MAARASIDFDRLRSDNPLSAVIGAVVKLCRSGNLLQGCCPFHEDRSPSFVVYPDQRYHCFGCNAGGDVVDFVMALHGVGYREALALLEGGRLPTAPARQFTSKDRTNSDRTAEAAALWSAASPIGGTPAEVYLRRRAIMIPLPDSLRFARLRFMGGHRPCLVALVQAANGDPQAVHRIFLDESGAKADLPGGKVKFSLGPLGGGAIRLSPVAREMGLCASVEDGLSLIALTALPVWAVTGDTMLDRFDLPPSVRSVVVGHDADRSGIEAANRAAQRHAEQGLRVRILPPAKRAKDFNQELQEARL
ncbi:DNA primase [Sphingobium xenophagum]|uniref:DNA primase n=1 Tax=Sphingobium xenophagum TaxID=121428 RepID=A0ABU1X2I1_SPHXE|nr:CHC2 zinc finger domain-containing protein [Sphingobium xenophagum]MDR7155371.1 DNA primase [Sphingobium xenophagum]